MNLRQRSYQKELLDRDDILFQDIRQNMHELDFINRWLGGHAITIKGLRSLINKNEELLICEIGCGGGDNIQALHKWCSKKGITASFIGIDIKKECIEYAKSKYITTSNTEWIVTDYRKVVFEKHPNVIFSSLFCHHFTNEDLVEQVKWMYKNSTTGFFINDLQRHFLAYYSIKYFTSVLSSSYLVKNDAPLSVARGFKKKEWKDIFSQAGIEAETISWQWAFRYLVTCKHERDN